MYEGGWSRPRSPFWLLPVVLFGLLAFFTTVTGFATANPVFWWVLIASCFLAIVVMLRLDAVAASLVIVVSVIVDWYLSLHIVAPTLALLLLLLFFLGPSEQRPRVQLPGLWLWAVFLVMTIAPAYRGANTGYDTLAYYPNLILGACIVFWLGTTLARTTAMLVHFFSAASLFATLIALHIVVEALTGKLYFTTPNVDVFLASTSYYALGITGISRLGSFFIQPDEASAFLAMMLFLPLGLFLHSHRLLSKLWYVCSMLLMVVGLLFTYSAAAWLAAVMGLVIFLFLLGAMRYHVQTGLSILAAVALLLVGFSAQINFLLAHAAAANTMGTRQALWSTALRVIVAFPLTGVGFSRATYLQRSAVFRVSEQLVPVNNPHNSYLEWAAMGGIPVLCVFLGLLLFALYCALRNWKVAHFTVRPLLAAGIAATLTLSINSWSFGLWTLAPLAIPGWLILGVVASPLLARRMGATQGEG